MLEIKITGKPGQGKSTLLHVLGKCLKDKRVNVTVFDEKPFPLLPEGWIGAEPDDREVLIRTEESLPKPVSDPGWVPCTSWDELPVGTWLVKITKDRKPYQVAVVTQRADDPKTRMVIVGGYFSWDMGLPLAYTSFEPYDG